MQGYDVMEEMYNAKTAAMNFVQEVCKVRQKGNLADFMSICIGVMNEYKVRSLLLVSLPDSCTSSDAACAAVALMLNVSPSLCISGDLCDREDLIEQEDY